MSIPAGPEKEGRFTLSYTEKLFDFIESSPTACHTVETLREILLGAGFTELYEQQLQQYRRHEMCIRDRLWGT